MAGRVTVLLVCFSIAVASAIPLPVPVVRNSQSEKKPSPYAHAVERRWIDRERPMPTHLMLRPHVSVQEQETTQPSGLLSRLRSGRIFYLLLYTYPYDPDRPIFGWTLTHELTETDLSNSIMALDYACVFESTSLYYSSWHLPGVFTEVTRNVLFLQFKIVTAQQINDNCLS